MDFVVEGKDFWVTTERGCYCMSLVIPVSLYLLEITCTLFYFPCAVFCQSYLCTNPKQGSNNYYKKKGFLLKILGFLLVGIGNHWFGRERKKKLLLIFNWHFYLCNIYSCVLFVDKRLKTWISLSPMNKRIISWMMK